MYSNNKVVGGKINFAKMVDADIYKCQAFLKSERAEADGTRLFREIAAKYSNQVDDFGSNMYGYSPEMKSFMMEWIVGASLIENIETAMYKLIALQSNGYRNPQRDTASRVNVVNNNQASATSIVNIEITFENARKIIEEMPGLSETDTKETLDKIDQIRSIVELNEPKKTKWQKCKPILAWIADKSVDVGITLLPLLLSI